MKNSKWDDEEVVLLVDLYFQIKNNNIQANKVKSQINSLSQILIKRAELLGYNISNTFRNDKGIKMKLANIQYIDTNGKLGLSGASNKDREYVDKYNTDYNTFVDFAESVKNKYK